MNMYEITYQKEHSDGDMSIVFKHQVTSSTELNATAFFGQVFNRYENFALHIHNVDLVEVLRKKEWV